MTAEQTIMSLILDSLEIKNFRAFKHLRIEKLGRVNLIVGKNNVGKTCVLEALLLFARRAYPALIWESLGVRDESAVLNSKKPADLGDTSADVKYLFHGRKPITEQVDPIEIGSSQSPQGMLSLVTYWPDIHANKNLSDMVKPDEYDSAFMAPGIAVTIGSDVRAIYPLDGNYSVRWQTKSFEGKMREVPCIFVGNYGLQSSLTSRLWDNIALSSLEREIVSALQIIAPKVTRVNLIGSRDRNAERIPIVKDDALDVPVPLRSMGEGMYRMFSIALALVNAKDGMLLIDEVDTGLHYSVLPDLWRLIFEVAHRLNVQVFSTTHSWDCIQAFQQAADANTEEEGMLIRLEHRDGDVVPVMFDERKLNIAAREQIEVR